MRHNLAATPRRCCCCCSVCEEELEVISGNERDSRGVENVYGKIADPVLYQFGAGEKVSKMVDYKKKRTGIPRTTGCI